jgi:hypothetical protein
LTPFGVQDCPRPGVKITNERTGLQNKRVRGAKVLARGLGIVGSLLRQIDSASGKWIPESGNF